MQKRTHSRSFAPVALVLICGLLGAVPAMAQVERVIDPNWTTPRTPDGQPDLQGIWGNKTITPIERPANESRAFLSDEEMAGLNQQRAINSAEQDAAPAQRTEAGRNVGGYGSYWLDSGDTVLSTGQTSFVVDPPDGRAPVKQWALDMKAYNLANEGDHYQHLSVWDRCLSRGVPGSMLPAGYNNAYNIVQTPDHVVIYHEMIHDVRVIPVDGRPRLTENIRQWNGSSRGRWEGNTLVVETTNFSDQTENRFPSSRHTRAIERFTRVSNDTIDYRFTVEDPTIYTRPWTAVRPMPRLKDYVMYEYACHEGNYAMSTILSGQRTIERRRAEASAKRQ